MSGNGNEMHGIHWVLYAAYECDDSETFRKAQEKSDDLAWR